jgi:hypothetical protein
MPGSGALAGLARAGVRVEWLLTGAEPMLLEPPKVEQPSAPPYTISASEAGPLIVALEQELGYDPGSAWTSLLIGLMTDHGLKPSGARKVLEHLAAFRAARDAA